MDVNELYMLLRQMNFQCDIIYVVMDFILSPCVKCSKCNRGVLRLERESLIDESSVQKFGENCVIRGGYLVIGESVALPELTNGTSGFSIVHREGRCFERCPEVYRMLRPFTRVLDVAVCDECRLAVFRQQRRIFCRWRDGSRRIDFE